MPTLQEYDVDLDSGLSDEPAFDPSLVGLPGEAPTGFGDYIGASVDSMADDNLFFTSIDRVRLGWEGIGKPRVSQQDAQKQLSDLGVNYTAPAHGMTQDTIDYIKWKNDRKQTRQDLFDRNKSTAAYLLGSSAYFGGTLAFDPITTGSAFIPVIREARYAAALAKYSSPLARGAVRAGAGAVEGAVGAAVLVPLQGDKADFLGENYGVAEVFAEIFFGAALGSAAHVTGGALYDAAGSAARAFERRMSADQKAAILEDTIVRLENDLPPDVPGAIAEVTGGKFDPRAALVDTEFGQARLADAKAIVETATLGSRGDDLLSEIISLGGISIRDGSGAVTREGAEVLEVIKDAVVLKKRGIINNGKGGKRIDKITEALAEAGWLSSKDKGEVYPDEVYDLLRQLADGDTPMKKFGDGGDPVVNEANKILKRAGVRANTPPDVAIKRVSEMLIEEAIENGDVEDLLVDLATRYEMANPTPERAAPGEFVPFDRGDLPDPPMMRNPDGSPVEMDDIPPQFEPTTEHDKIMSQIEELTAVADEELALLEEWGIATKQERDFVDETVKMTEKNYETVRSAWQAVGACMIEGMV